MVIVWLYLGFKSYKMTTKREIRKDLYTVSQYAKIKDVSTTAVYKMIKELRVNTVQINGATLIKL